VTIRMHDIGEASRRVELLTTSNPALPPSDH
jgi:hypothetical protein